MSKTYSFYLSLGLVAILAVGAIFASSYAMFVPDASAQALTANELFGGNSSYNGGNFASDAGLGAEDLPSTIASIVRVAIGFLGVIAVIIILIGGFKYMLAGGEEKKATEAKKYIIVGIIGLAIVLSAYAIAEFVISSLTNAIAPAPISNSNAI